jgi:hypothetical protein
MAVPIRVKSLIALLNYFGLEHRDIAERLGVTPSLISLLGTGKRPLSQKLEAPFMNLVLRELREDARRLTTGLVHERQVNAYLQAWANEMSTQINAVLEEIRAAVRTIQALDTTENPLHWSPVEKTRLRDASRTLARHLEDLWSLDLMTFMAMGQWIIVDPVSHVEMLYRVYAGLSAVEGD